MLFLPVTLHFFFPVFFFVFGLGENNNKQKNVAAEGKNRRVLQDIGNLVAKQAEPGANNVSKRTTRCFYYYTPMYSF